MLAHCPEHRNTLTRDPAAQGVVPDLVLSGHTGFVYAEPGETPEPGTENAPAMDELISAYQTHYNLGHPSMVADFYVDDAMAAFANLPATEGHDAISTLMVERMAANPADVTINEIGTIDLGEGWALDGGWYEMAAKDGGAAIGTGMFLLLVNDTSEGWRIKWAVTNSRPADTM